MSTHGPAEMLGTDLLALLSAVLNGIKIVTAGFIKLTPERG